LSYSAAGHGQPQQQQVSMHEQLQPQHEQPPVVS
jgi:hypothetical protein